MSERLYLPNLASIHSQCMNLQWTWKTLGEKAFCSPNTITKLKSGGGKGFLMCTFAKLSRALGMPVRDLILSEGSSDAEIKGPSDSAPRGRHESDVSMGEEDAEPSGASQDAAAESSRSFRDKVVFEPADFDDEGSSSSPPSPLSLNDEIEAEALDFVQVLLKLRLPKDYSEFDEGTDLVAIYNLLKRLLGNRIRILGVMESSVTVAIAIPSELIHPLTIAWHKKELDTLDVAQLYFRPLPVPPFPYADRLRSKLQSEEIMHLFKLTASPDGSFTLVKRQPQAEGVPVESPVGD